MPSPPSPSIVRFHSNPHRSHIARSRCATRAHTQNLLPDTIRPRSHPKPRPPNFHPIKLASKFARSPATQAFPLKVPLNCPHGKVPHRSPHSRSRTQGPAQGPAQTLTQNFTPNLAQTLIPNPHSKSRSNPHYRAKTPKTIATAQSTTKPTTKPIARPTVPTQSTHSSSRQSARIVTSPQPDSTLSTSALSDSANSNPSINPSGVASQPNKSLTASRAMPLVDDSAYAPPARCPRAGSLRPRKKHRDKHRDKHRANHAHRPQSARFDRLIAIGRSDLARQLLQQIPISLTNDDSPEFNDLRRQFNALNTTLEQRCALERNFIDLLTAMCAAHQRDLNALELATSVPRREQKLGNNKETRPSLAPHVLSMAIAPKGDNRLRNRFRNRLSEQNPTTNSQHSPWPSHSASKPTGRRTLHPPTTRRANPKHPTHAGCVQHHAQSSFDALLALLCRHARGSRPLRRSMNTPIDSDSSSISTITLPSPAHKDKPTSQNSDTQAPMDKRTPSQAVLQTKGIRAKGPRAKGLCQRARFIAALLEDRTQPTTTRRSHRHHRRRLWKNAPSSLSTSIAIRLYPEPDPTLSTRAILLAAASLTSSTTKPQKARQFLDLLPNSLAKDRHRPHRQFIPGRHRTPAQKGCSARRLARISPLEPPPKDKPRKSHYCSDESAKASSHGLVAPTSPGLEWRALATSPIGRPRVALRHYANTASNGDAEGLGQVLYLSLALANRRVPEPIILAEIISALARRRPRCRSARRRL